MLKIPALKGPQTVSSGFSLVELMVVVTVMAVMTIFGSIFYRGIQVDQRDHRRFNDLVSIQQALEMYRSRHSSYPAAATYQADLVPAFLPLFPPDPTQGRHYDYHPYPDSPPCNGTNCSWFVLCARRESTTVFEQPGWCISDGNCAGTAGDCDMGITSDQ